jgi:hypothetical protein
MKCLLRWDMGFLFCKDNAVNKSSAVEESLEMILLQTCSILKTLFYIIKQSEGFHYAYYSILS